MFLKVIEFYNDLEKYGLDGPENEINKMIGCRLMQDLEDTFDEEENPKTSTFYFSHSTMMMLLLNILGASEDPYKITHDLYDTYNGNSRNFRTSTLTPMASNVGFVLFDCIESSDISEITKKVVAYHNERPLFFKRCNNSFSCNWEQFKEIFEVRIKLFVRDVKDQILLHQ